MKLVVFLLTGLMMASQVNASSFKGYKRQPTAQMTTNTGSIVRFIETEKDFLILISGYAAFYRFPKTVSYADQVRGYLNSRMKNKKAVVFEIDPRTAEIISLSDPAN